MLAAAALAGLFAFTSSALAKPQPGDVDRSWQTVFPLYSVANAVAIDNKGRIVVAGNSGRRFALARYEPSGRLDHSLAGHGKLATRFDDARAFGTDVAIGPKHSIAVAGSACQGSSCEFAVARYESDGHPNRSFGDAGTVTLGFPGSSTALATGVAFASKGRVLITGSACGRSGCRFALARLDRHGKLDPSFGKGGLVTTQFAGRAGNPVSARATALAIDSRGRIVLGGGTPDKTALARYKPNGAPVRSFGLDGTVLKHLSHLGEINTLAVDAKDKVVAAGEDRQEFWRWALARFGKHGGIDSSFGRGGQVSTVGTQHHSRNVNANALAIDSRNRIVVSGTPSFSLVRYQSRATSTSPLATAARSMTTSASVAPTGWQSIPGTGQWPQAGLVASSPSRAFSASAYRS